jgi:hypothetical protein
VVRQIILAIVLSAFCLLSKSQIVISGIVLDQKRNPLPGANVYFEGSFNGTITDTAGKFVLKEQEPELNILVISYMGYNEKRITIDRKQKSVFLEIRMEEKMTALKDVVITAGTFGSTDQKKAVILNAYDIATTASAMGDIYGALHTLPGNSFVGEDGGLFVRGGEGNEARTFIEGLLVHKPYTSRMPDLPARGRFSPVLFSGTMFSTGGFSAEYGQAMSSALILSTEGTVARKGTNFGILPFGGSASHAQSFHDGALSVSGDYFNMRYYYKLFPQEICWIKEPETMTGNLMYRQKIRQKGMLKVFAAAEFSSSILSIEEPGTANMTRYGLQNSNGYWNAVYSQELSNLWSMRTGFSITADRDNIKPAEDHFTATETDLYVKQVFSRSEQKNLSLKAGAEMNLRNYRQIYFRQSDGLSVRQGLNGLESAVFTEGEYKIAGKVSLRGGLRSEYNEYNKELNLSPRFAVAFKTSDFSQISAAWGYYTQLPETRYLMINHELTNQQAIHYIVNYQWIKQNQTFRAEIYYKNYQHLLRYDSLYAPYKYQYNSGGYGFARGIDLFWRDKKTLKNADYWLSYSYLDTRRLFHDYPVAARPPWFPDHTFSAVYKQYFSRINIQLLSSFSAMSGRPYEDPNKEGFMNSTTPVYTDLSIGGSYVLIKKANLYILHAQITNVLGSKQIYGYRYAKEPDANGFYAFKQLKPPVKRMFIVGIFLYFNYF